MADHIRFITRDNCRGREAPRSRHDLERALGAIRTDDQRNENAASKVLCEMLDREPRQANIAAAPPDRLDLHEAGAKCRAGIIIAGCGIMAPADDKIPSLAVPSRGIGNAPRIYAQFRKAVLAFSYPIGRSRVGAS
jgi:hypothetical protein